MAKADVNPYVTVVNLGCVAARVFPVSLMFVDL